jgi:hypothetical protein
MDFLNKNLFSIEIRKLLVQNSYYIFFSAFLKAPVVRLAQATVLISFASSNVFHFTALLISFANPF